MIGRCLIRSWNLKRITCNPRYLLVSLIWLAGWYKLNASDNIHPLGADREDCPMLSWGGASDQIENASSLAGDLSFLLFGLESPFDLCYWVRRPQLRERSANCLMIWKDHWSRMNPSHHIGLLDWARVYTCSDIVDFLKSYRTNPTIELVLIAIGVEPDYRFISRSLFGWGPKVEPNAPVAAESEMTDLFRLLKLIWQPDLSMLAISVELEYRSVTRSLSR
jgi:hypothetical protein